MKREFGETFEDYKERRSVANKDLKMKLKGKMVWFSKNIRNSQREFNKGTYIKAEHGKLS
jgi:hypothetical protein